MPRPKRGPDAGTAPKPKRNCYACAAPKWLGFYKVFCDKQDRIVTDPHEEKTCFVEESTAARARQEG